MNLTPVQNFLARRAIVYLQNKLDTKVSLEHIRIDFLNHAVIEGLYIEDRAHDTLLYAGEARVRISDWFILKKDKPVIHYIGLRNAYVHMYRTSGSGDWNYKFIEDAFDTGPSDTTKPKKQSKFELDLKKVDLRQVRFHMDDAWVGSDMDIDVGNFALSADNIDLKKKIIDVNSIAIGASGIYLRDYKGGRPPRKRKPPTIDTTAFNPDNWAVNLGRLSLDNCFFGLDASEEPPTPREFDPDHIHISNINIAAQHLTITGDTLRARMNNLAARERSGIVIKQMKADVTVSPNASICENLFLATNNSRLQGYYAMRYTRFPDFEDYIDKVVMEADLHNSSADANDVGYFAPQLRRWPGVIKVSGYAKGTVADLHGHNLQLSDGSMIVKGDLAMRGLPDINTTWIEYNNGEIYTNGAAIFKYAPGLRNNPNLALERVSHAYFKGSYTGYIENFAANGILVTNLGTVRSDVKMNIPGFSQRSATYSGTVSTDNFDVGTLFRQPDLGIVTFHSNVSGNAFDPKDAKVKINAFFDRLDYRQYPYRNITAQGILEKNKFNGDVIVDDPNLALAFNGDIDFTQKQLAINAKANLLYGDLTALKLTKDTITASGDFDLDWHGNNIDNFQGYARLYNINMIRNGHHLDLDSIYVNSVQDEKGQLLTIESNALRATITGKYQLSTLPASVQYYVASYLPNYFDLPAGKVSEQDLNFEVQTKDIDSLLGVVVPNIKGFNNAVISGKLNTIKQELSLDAKIPYGMIGDIGFEHISIASDGNFKLLGINAEAENVTLADVLHGSISLTTTLGNDSMQFNVATTSSADYGTATVNGRAYARGDSLYISLLPSEFYMNKVRWEIPDGSQGIISDKYIFIKDLYLRSGVQEISINSQNSNTSQAIMVNAANLDMAQLGYFAGLSEYEPGGLMNGTIKISNPLTDVIVAADLKATNVRFGTDTLGNVDAVGSYDAKKHMLTLDPASGVYKGNASINAAGRIIFDSTSNQKLDGNVQFNNAPIAWVSPFVEGYVSSIDGMLNGKVNVSGTASEPDVEGDVKMTNAAFRIDFLGTNYTIPTATIKVDNKEINLGDITLYDVYKHRAILNGRITHNRFKDLRLAMNMGSSKFEVINLKDYESESFYGNLIAGFQNLSVTGPADDIRIRITRAMPADKSHLYIPIGTTSSQASYSYVSFKSPDTVKVAQKKKIKNKLNISIDARLNTLAEITLVLDPAAGDAINATGTGNLNMEIPSDNDIRMYGIYDIEQGDYLFTLKRFFFKRKFDLDPGSRINFNGLVSQTSLNVVGNYTVRTRLIDLLNAQQKTAVSRSNDREFREANVLRDVNVVLYMKGSLESPKLTFKLDIPEKTEGSITALEVQRVNQNEGELYNQVASLLLIGSFFPQGDIGSSASTGAISNVSEVLSGTASSQLTNLVNRLTGDKDLSVNLKYSTYSLNDPANINNPGGQSRSAVTFGFSKNLLNDRLTVDYGGSYDWGKPTAASQKGTYFNPVGDFRLQYQFREGGNLRGYIFRTSNFDAVSEKNLSRGGLGISWRKSFNNITELFRGNKYARRKLEEQQAQQDTLGARGGGTY